MSTESQGNGAPEASQGQATPEGAGGSEQPKPLTNEDFNRAFSARFSQVEKKIESRINDALTQATGKLEGNLVEKLSALLAGKQPESAGDDAAVAGQATNQQSAGQSQPSPKDPELIAMKRQLTEVKNKLAEAERVSAEKEAAAKQARLRSTVAEKLATHGVDANRARHAVGYLVDSAQLIKVDGDNVLFRLADGEFADLDSGIREWISSDDGKLYLPPRGIAGSGSETPSRQSGRVNAPSDPRAAALKLIRDSWNT